MLGDGPPRELAPYRQMISPYFLPSLRLCIGALAALGLAAPVGAYQEQPQEQGTVGPAEMLCDKE